MRRILSVDYVLMLKDEREKVVYIFVFVDEKRVEIPFLTVVYYVFARHPAL